MATTITYAAALSTAIAFMESNGFEDAGVLDKLRKLQTQKATTVQKGESKAHKANVALAQSLVNEMRARDVREIRAAWVVEHVVGVNTSPKAVAVLNAATDAGLLIKTAVDKTPTRKEFVFTLAE